MPREVPKQYAGPPAEESLPAAGVPIPDLPFRVWLPVDPEQEVLSLVQTQFLNFLLEGSFVGVACC